MLKELFDFKFEKLVTRKILGAVYAIVVVLVSLASAFVFLAALVQIFQGNFPLIALLALVAVPVAWFISIVLLRVAFESSIALVIVAENTKK
ncbi:MAG: hypothetical protein RLZZ06_22 [Actinomycetota bacterium]|jgi:cation transport ATPase